MAEEKKNKKDKVITDKRFYSDGNDFVVLKKVVDGKVVFDNTKKAKKKTLRPRNNYE